MGGPVGAWRTSYPAIVLAAIALLVHLIVNNGFYYGASSDELYFIVCGQHPAMGYVDQPPLVPWIAGLSHALFGTTLLPLRLIPALAMTATVALTAEFARALCGGRFAQWLSGLTVLLGAALNDAQHAHLRRATKIVQGELAAGRCM